MGHRLVKGVSLRSKYTVHSFNVSDLVWEWNRIKGRVLLIASVVSHVRFLTSCCDFNFLGMECRGVQFCGASVQKAPSTPGPFRISLDNF